MPAANDRDQIEQYLTAMRERALQQRDAASTARDAVTEVTTLTASAETFGGAVRATVDSGGGLRELVLADTMRGRPPSEIAQHVLQCVQQAQAKLAARTLESVAKRLGDHPVAALFAGQFGDTAPPPAPTGETAGRSRPPDGDDELPSPVVIVDPTKGW